MNFILASCLLIAVFTQNIRDTQTCNYVGDNCPVWNGWSPKCHVGTPQCQGYHCTVEVCTYSAAHTFGTSTDLRAAIDGIIDDAGVKDGYNCAPWQGKGTSSFLVHCACGGSCSFHGNYIVYYTRRAAEEEFSNEDGNE